ncbi:MAG: hypothetical protein IKE58_03790 [Blautia sp.]|nr:hypothetical protein [Blautia sp.]
MEKSRKIMIVLLTALCFFLTTTSASLTEVLAFDLDGFLDVSGISMGDDMDFQFSPLIESPALEAFNGTWKADLIYFDDMTMDYDMVNPALEIQIKDGQLFFHEDVYEWQDADPLEFFAVPVFENGALFYDGGSAEFMRTLTLRLHEDGTMSDEYLEYLNGTGVNADQLDEGCTVYRKIDENTSVMFPEIPQQAPVAEAPAEEAVPEPEIPQQAPVAEAPAEEAVPEPEILQQAPVAEAPAEEPVAVASQEIPETVVPTQVDGSISPVVTTADLKDFNGSWTARRVCFGTTAVPYEMFGPGLTVKILDGFLLFHEDAGKEGAEPTEFAVKANLENGTLSFTGTENEAFHSLNLCLHEDGSMSDGYNDYLNSQLSNSTGLFTGFTVFTKNE